MRVMAETFTLQGRDHVTGEPCDVEISAGELLDLADRLRAQQEGGTGSLVELYPPDDDLPPAAA